MVMIILSHLANVLIVAAVVFGLWRGQPDVDEAFGTDTTARRILGCIYATIGLVSLYALTQLVAGNPQIAFLVGATLFPVQIIYKLFTVFVVGPTNPVVIANLMVAALHSATLLIAY